MLLDTLIGGPVAPPYLTGKRGKLESGNYDPEFPLKWMYKDLQMVTSAAGEASAPTPLADLVKAHYQDATERGWGEADFSSLYGYSRETVEEDG